MDIELFYKEIGEDSDEIQDTLGLPDEFIEKYLTKFYEDKNYDKLVKAMEANDLKEIEMAAHTLKGSALNLGFSNFVKSSKALVDAVRNDEVDQLAQLFEATQKDYTDLIHAYEHAQG